MKCWHCQDTEAKRHIVSLIEFDDDDLLTFGTHLGSEQIWICEDCISVVRREIHLTIQSLRVSPPLVIGGGDGAAE